MNPTEHPSHWLNNHIVEDIRRTAAEAEVMRQLHPDQLNIIYQQRWLKMFVPKKFGGLELSIPEILRIEESLAWTDGSTAWVVTLCAGAAWFIGFLDQSLAQEVFSNDSVFFAGSGAITGSAEIIPEGYLLNGNWKYASGSLHATIFTANGVIHKNGKPLLLPNGSPVVRAFLM
ncbi:MAG: acyl-CoA dehydrogenase, partial [Bacteroidetes bacterium]|nr:acyl-CoA dehydrogenase [Bacteroidota bacterium]